MTYHPFFNKVPVKLTIFCIIYMSILIVVSPAVDHLFTTLEDDKKRKESNTRILYEIILHTVVISIGWYYFNYYMQNTLAKVLNIAVREHTKTAIEFIMALACIGLQANLIDKLEYISLEHPFRFHFPKLGI